MHAGSQGEKEKTKTGNNTHFAYIYIPLLIHLHYRTLSDPKHDGANFQQRRNPEPFPTPSESTAASTPQASSTPTNAQDTPGGDVTALLAGLNSDPNNNQVPSATDIDLMRAGNAVLTAGGMHAKNPPDMTNAQERKGQRQEIINTTLDVGTFNDTVLLRPDESTLDRISHQELLPLPLMR